MKSDQLMQIIRIGNEEGVVDLNTPVYRFTGNPLLTASEINKVWTHPSLQVKTVHNAGIVEFKGKILMLFRSHLRNGVSVIGLAKSKDGVINWEIDPYPAMLPCTKDDSFIKGVNKDEIIKSEEGGVEDPRINKIEDKYIITYSAYSVIKRDHVYVSMAVTEDFKTFTRYGPVLKTNMRNVVFFPEKIKGKYVGLFRPNNKFREIRIGYSKNWKPKNWSLSKKPIIKTGFGPSAISSKIGPGIPPMKTKEGWLSIFHGVRFTMGGNPYVLSVALHDLENPEKVIVSNIPILFPSRLDCRVKDSDYIHVPNVVFSCGGLHKKDGTIYIYYGGSDTVMNIGVTHEDILIRLCKQFGQNPITGEPLYNIRNFLKTKKKF